ncbi:MAG: RpiB/LacA/LacB family sugar-phosphate isomerase [Dehalococcoidia bacterium]|nr:RpiB/LacA/LacB family sugar-phosphate isomerase [Dehalococcoidia bacterium]
MRVAVGGDHAGFDMKNLISEHVKSLGHMVVDAGAYEYDALDDFTDFSEAVAVRVADGRAERGLIVCGSGVGASVAANKVRGIRAGLCHDTYSARQGVEHDDMNVVCIGARIIGEELAKAVVTAFLSASFIEDEEKYVRRLNKVLDIERRNA